MKYSLMYIEWRMNNYTLGHLQTFMNSLELRFCYKIAIILWVFTFWSTNVTTSASLLNDSKFLWKEFYPNFFLSNALWSRTWLIFISSWSGINKQSLEEIHISIHRLLQLQVFSTRFFSSFIHLYHQKIGTSLYDHRHRLMILLVSQPSISGHNRHIAQNCHFVLLCYISKTFYSNIWAYISYVGPAHHYLQYTIPRVPGIMHGKYENQLVPRS